MRIFFDQRQPQTSEALHWKPKSTAQTDLNASLSCVVVRKRTVAYTRNVFNTRGATQYECEHIKSSAWDCSKIRPPESSVMIKSIESAFNDPAKAGEV